MKRLKETVTPDEPPMQTWYWGVDEGQPGTLITVVEATSSRKIRARIGIGQTHHFALAVSDEAAQLAWRERLVRAGRPVSPVMERIYFKSIYTRDFDGHIVELATSGPGFSVDESLESLGQRLQLPPWIEAQRQQIEAGLKPLQVPPWNPVKEHTT